MRTDKRISQKPDKKGASRIHKRGIVGYSKKSALLEEAITHMNTGKYGRSSAALKELLALDPQNIEARRLFATLHLRLGSLVTARQAFESLANEAIGRQDYWLAESLLREYLAAGPRCVPFLEQLGHVYQEKGDEMAAVAELGKAIEILRDDPDVDNPQKAAQLYAKIRELAPASSVALQLAPLFDVQTGEFIAPPPTPSTASLDDDAGSHESVLLPDTGPVQAVVEQRLPDVMPWEIPDDSSPPPESEEAELSPLTESVQVSEFPPMTFTENVPPSVEASTDQMADQESANEDTSFSFKVTEDISSELSSDEPMPEAGRNESPSEMPSGIPSPMPWEQLADASVQIVEPEIPPSPDASTLESILSALRTEEQAVAPTAVTEVLIPAPATDNAGPAETIPSEAGVTESAPLSAPMPWEQISDPAIQIPVPEPSSLRPEEFLATVSPISLESSTPVLAAEVATAAQETVTDSMEAQTESRASSSSASSAADVPPATSFSWNAVFDKAWKFTAGTMAPSPPVPSETGLGSSEKPEQTETHVWESSVADFPLAPPQSAQDEGTAPVVQPTPIAFPAIDEEESMPEVAAAPTVEPPTPATKPAPSETTSHWNTGEVAVQVHRPSKKKKRWEKDPEETEPTTSPPTEPQSPTSQDTVREWKSTTQEEVPPTAEVVSSPAERPDWMQASAAITFARPEPSPAQPRWSDVGMTVPSVDEPVNAAAVSAVDTLFSPSATVDDLHPHLSWSKPRPRFMARLHRVRIGISSFIGACFSTTRSLTFLALMLTIAILVVGAAGAAAVGVMWMAMEDPPSPLYQSLTISPPRMISDPRKNGYLLLLGFDAPAGQDPVQVGYERKPAQEHDRAALQGCTGGHETTSVVGTGGAYDHVVKGWVRSGDPLSPIKGQAGILKALSLRESTALARYQQWLTMSFDDWGFGQLLSPNCTHVLLVHRLFVLEGFNQDVSTGLDRLEADVQAWRGALGQSKTLAIKMLAVTAVQDDASIVSSLLSRADLDGQALVRLSRIVRPLDQTELSVRWPMQSQFVWATKSVPSELKEDKSQDRPWHASMAAAMRLPVQRRANAYAEYYDAANKAVAGGRHMNLPKLSTFVRTPPSGVTDYLANPVEHIVGLEPLPSWDPYVMRMIEADAQLRLAGLQAWLRRGPQDGDVLMRLAKAGQAYYDPFTGLPMLVNQRKGVIYSVGRDGKDQEGDDMRDLTAMIPLSVSDYRRTASASSR